MAQLAGPVAGVDRPNAEAISSPFLTNYRKVGNVVSGCFACFGDDMAHEVGVQAKVMLSINSAKRGLIAGVCQGPWRVAVRPRCCKRHAQRARHLAAISFIDE